MAHPGFNPADERAWWWKVAKHLDAAQLALVNAIAHNVDDPRPLQALQERLRESTAILLHILGVKGLMPGAPRPPQQQHAQHVQQHAQPPGPPPLWAAPPSEAPPPWFPPDFPPDLAAAAAAAAAAAVVTTAPTSDPGEPIAADAQAAPQVAHAAAPLVDSAPAAPLADGEPAVPTSGEADHEASASGVDQAHVTTTETPPEVPGGTAPPAPSAPTSSDAAT
jgi:hypothetical protein